MCAVHATPRNEAWLCVWSHPLPARLRILRKVTEKETLMLGGGRFLILDPLVFFFLLGANDSKSVLSVMSIEYSRFCLDINLDRGKVLELASASALKQCLGKLTSQAPDE